MEIARRGGIDVSAYEEKAVGYEEYRGLPRLYAEKVLNVEWWDKQQEIANALIAHKRVFVKASHSVGKTHLAGGLVNWFYDAFNPSICLTTAPTGQQVKDVLWKEVRVQRNGRPGLQPKAPRLESAANHFAVGYTAESADAFQGRHEAAVLIIFDEATGIDGAFWDAAEGMMTGENCYWLVIMNPTDTASRAYQEEENGKWHSISVSALDHPNIADELAGRAVRFPSAVRLAWVEERLAEWCTPLEAKDALSGDIEFPPGSGVWYRPGALAEARMLGRWPTAGSTSVWTEAMWKAATEKQQEVDRFSHVVIGCDVARFGDDFTSIVVRRGNCALWHETHNGWSTAQTAGRLKQLCAEYAALGRSPQQIPVHVDDDGVGGGVIDQKGEYNFLPVSGAETAIHASDYPNKRSELWFVTAEKANKRELDLTRLTPASLKLLKAQCMAPVWKLDNQGRRVVEPKADTKKRIGRSPDDADALNLAFCIGKRTIHAA